MMERNRIFAHTLAGAPSADWEELYDHLDRVADRAAAFASAFGAPQWGHALGRCHDLGKASAAFQAKLASAGTDARDAGAEDQVHGRVDHSTYGARYLKTICTNANGACGWMLAYAAAGHHAGLANWTPPVDSDRSTLPYRMSGQYKIHDVPEPELTLPSIDLPWKIDPASGGRQQEMLRRAAFSYALFTRMVFSALVDADRLCTEEFCSPAQAEERREGRPGLEAMQAKLSRYLQCMQEAAAPTLVNASRRSVLEQCLAAARSRPGFFSLQVPTGGGKTLASLAFALEHALHAGDAMRRVIVAIPFTSIIEQTADVYRAALGDLAPSTILEHHSNVQSHRDTRANQLATENWDAPLIVTTNVQLLETLFAAKTSPCRKLHRVAGSVIILDEAQMLPTELLEPTLAALRELVDHYECSIVLCTATQPALEWREDFAIGIRGVRPIIPAPKPLFDSLRRVEVQALGPIADDDLSRRLAKEDRVLCIVNTRPHALQLFKNLQMRTAEQECVHLSTLMCGAHRREVLKGVRSRLAEPGRTVRIVSTQLIEAGVDIDLPVVYRATAGLDSIAQASGRCNREGLASLGRTYIFDAEPGIPRGFQRKAAEVGREVLRRHAGDPLSPEAVQEYFRMLYWRQRDEWDKYGVMEMTRLVQNGAGLEPWFEFRQIAETYRLIRDTQLPILIPFDREAKEFARQLAGGFVEFLPQRKLQPYLVNVPKRMFEGMVASGVVLEHASGVGLLLREDAYDPATGLKLDAFGLDPELWGI